MLTGKQYGYNAVQHRLGACSNSLCTSKPNATWLLHNLIVNLNVCVTGDSALASVWQHSLQIHWQ